VVNPLAFSDTGGNANPHNVKEMFACLGVTDIFGQIKKRFDSCWRKPTAATFIPDKLDEIVNRRHIVAHTADALKITRSDLNESLKFLKILARLLDIELRKHVDGILKTR